ncbi:MAG: hypothetical protein QW685_07335 [Saccharolobus sp.]
MPRVSIASLGIGIVAGILSFAWAADHYMGLSFLLRTPSKKSHKFHHLII